MDQHTRIDLTMMSLELRLAARGPADLVGQRLTPQRLLDIASMLERLLDGAEHGSTGRPGTPVGERNTAMRASSVARLVRQA